MTSDIVLSEISKRFTKNNLDEAMKFYDAIRSQNFYAADLSKTTLKLYDKNSIIPDFLGVLEIPVQTHTVDASYRYASYVVQNITPEKLEEAAKWMLPNEYVQFAVKGGVQSDLMVTNAPGFIEMNGAEGDDVIMSLGSHNHVTMNGGEGDDILDARESLFSILDGGSGNNILIGGCHYNTYNLGEGNNTVLGDLVGDDYVVVKGNAETTVVECNGKPDEWLVQVKNEAGEVTNVHILKDVEVIVVQDDEHQTTKAYIEKDFTEND